MTMRTKGVKMDFENLIAKGENPRGASGFLSQTVNGTAHWRGTGWNEEYDWQREQVAPGPTRPAGRSNRTAE
jgi:hypothetical protein